MKKKKSSRTAPVMREGRAGSVIRSVPVKQLMPSKKTPKPVDKKIPEAERAQPAQETTQPAERIAAPDVPTAQTQTLETETTAVLPPVPSTSSQIVAVPSLPSATGTAFSLGTVAVVASLLLSLGANVLLWKQYKGIASAMNALSAQYSAQQPVEITATALNGNLQAYTGKRVRINTLALLANHPRSSTLAAGRPDPKGLSIDVYYENAKNSPSIRALTPAPTKTVSITGTFNRYENENGWYIEAESIQ